MGAIGFGDDFGEVLAETVVGHAALDRDVQVRDIGELDGVVGVGIDRFGEVLADFVGVDVKGGGEFDVANVVAAKIDVHEAGNELVFRGILVILRRPARGMRRSCQHR